MSEREKLLDLLRRFIFLEDKDPLLKSEIHSYLSRLNLDLYTDIPEFDFAFELLNSFRSRITHKIEKFNLSRINRKDIGFSAPTPSYLDTYLNKIQREKNIYLYTYRFENLGGNLDRDYILVLEKKIGESAIIATLCAERVQYANSFSFDCLLGTLKHHEFIANFIENLRNYSDFYKLGRSSKKYDPFLFDLKKQDPTGG